MNLIPTRVVALVWSSLILLAAPVSAATVTATFSAATTIPVTAATYTATGNTVDFTLNFAPPVGTNLTVVKNTGSGPIQGAFDNLAQNQVVNLSYGGINYTFVANYVGGTGNDLVLHWANTRVVAWGAGDSGQLGNGKWSGSSVPVPVTMTGVLAGKTVLATAAGEYHGLALCSEGTVAAWGASTASNVPVWVNQSGVLAGRKIIAVSGGGSHNLALCSDGALAAWGDNYAGQLGNNSITYSTVPVLVNQTGVLAGKTVIAIAAGGSHSLALCSDGTLAAWGYNGLGQLGNNNTTNSNVPVLVDQTGVLAGKTPVAIAAGHVHSLALCADGTFATWGNNVNGQLGNNSDYDSKVPLLVDRTGVLASKTVVAMAAGIYHSVALCSDGTLAAWGVNSHGQLGNNSLTRSKVPVLVNQTGVLAGRTVTRLFAGDEHNLALCADGTLFAWGRNSSGQLGNHSMTDSKVPVAVNTSALGAGERFVTTGAGTAHSVALVASPPPPAAATTLAATGILDTGVTLNGSVSANGTATSVSFEYGLTSAYGATVAATPAPVTGTTPTAASATLSNLLSGSIYHYRVTATNSGGTLKGEDMTFTTTTFANLSNLELSSGTLAPAFTSINRNYIATVPNAVGTLAVTPAAASLTSTVKINGVTVASGMPGNPIQLLAGENVISIVVAAEDGINTQTYSVTVIRLPQAFVFNSATSVPLTVSNLLATGNTAGFTLNYAPTPGTHLTVVRNNGKNPIQGTFANLAQGQTVNLTYAGITYSFVANYFGGTGNDLVLHWANSRLLAWGANGSGQLGTNDRIQSNIPVPVDLTGVLAGRSVISIATGGTHGLALCADGTLAAWGDNTSGQLGNNSLTDSSLPVVVDQTGALAGKSVIAVVGGESHSFALCSDGTLAAWGRNYHGQLGINTTTDSKVPVLVNLAGVLAGKTITAISAGGYHSLALCSDGTLAAWGNNDNGQLGNAETVNSSVPVLVERSGVLAGKTILAISAGNLHSLALCSDGTLATWGYNRYGQLGNNTTTASSIPVLVNQTGVLAGKTVVAISANYHHCLALCSEGTVAAWGCNSNGQLGNNSLTDGTVPLLVNQSGALAGKTVIALATGSFHSLALCSNGTLAAWGDNSYGQLGNNGTTQSLVPVTSATAGLAAGESLVAVGGGSMYNLTLVVSPPPPVAVTLAATGVVDAGATLSGTVNAQGTPTAVTFEYGLTTSYGSTMAATPASVTGTLTTAASATPSGLLSGSTYHYRVVAKSAGGTVKGEDLTFTTTTFATLTNLTLSNATLVPSFASIQTRYTAAVPYATSSIRVTPVCLYPSSRVRVNEVIVASGTGSDPLNLAVGNNVVTTMVSAEGGGNTLTYTVTVTRLPQAFAFNSASDVPVTVSDFLATGHTANFILNHAPPPGTSLTVVKNTGLNRIQGTFANLAQWQLVPLTYNGVTYSFVANYLGGTGNDLVLQWANTRLVAWGGGDYGQLGNGKATSSSVPVPVDMTGVLSDKTLLTTASGVNHSLVLCLDGTLAAWGSNYSGELGNGIATRSVLPVLVNQTGVLAGKTVTAIAIGDRHSLVLCTDGTLAAWGAGGYGQLGTNTYTDSYVPVLVMQTGMPAGKTVVAIAAGYNHCLALCSDGTVAAWGSNSSGELGNGSTANSKVPVWVDQTGVLAGKQVVAISARGDFSLVQCADGSLAAWGKNTTGQLGNNSTATSNVPVLVDRTGVLSGKTVAAISAGVEFCLALCADGTVAAWGAGSAGQLGNNSTTPSSVPVCVSQTGVLAGRTVVAISAGGSHGTAFCSDGSLAAWGYNYNGQLGNNSTTSSTVPVLVSTTGLKTGERFATVGSGSNHSLALVAMPPPPVAATLPVTGITDTGCSLNGTVNAQGSATSVAFEYGLTTAYGNTLAATPAAVSGIVATAASATLGGLLPGTTFHYRIVTTSAGGNAKGEDMSFTTTTLSFLSGLTVSSGTLVPAFDGNVTTYALAVPFAAATLTATPMVANPGATVRANGVAVASGTASGPLELTAGDNQFTVEVTSADGINRRNYQLTVTRLPEVYTFSSAGTVPVTVGGFAVTGLTAAFALNFAPQTGTNLTVVKNTGTSPIHDTFANLAQWQVVNLTHAGMTYSFVANYYGGSGNDLVLQWANTRMLSWGNNNYGQLGNNSNAANSSVAVPVDMSGALAGKTVVATSVGGSHSLALCSDGTLTAWGYNNKGQLGNNSTSNSQVPVLVNHGGVLAGKTIIAISAGYAGSLALCSDGTLAAWGTGGYGQLGNGSTTNSNVPVLVDQSGVLAGRMVIAIVSGVNYFNLALCSDGAVVAWGFNQYGQLGNGSTTNSNVPVLVNQTGGLAGKKVVALAAGSNHCLALCSDGSLAAWGFNSDGQLGNNNMTDSSTPIGVNTAGVLVGKTIIGLAAGSAHSLALCSDGTLAAWGYNGYGELGNNSTTSSMVPTLVNQNDVLAGKTVAAISAGGKQGYALCSDGTLAAWGYNNYGQLGNNSTTTSKVPALVNTSAQVAGERFVAVAGGVDHNLARVASPPAVATAQPASVITGISATLNGMVNANGSTTSVSFEFGLTSTYGSTIEGIPISVTGGSNTSVHAPISGLTPGTTYHYRVVASSNGGIARSADMAFTTRSNNAWLAGLSLNAGALVPDFAKTTVSYFATVPFATDGVRVTPVTDHPAAAVKINGTVVPSGTASGEISLALGNNIITTVVTAEDGITTKTYTITVTRLPLNFTFHSATDVPVSADGFAASGIPVDIVLDYAPVPGTALTMVNNTGLRFIHGTFGNLAQGQRVTLTYGGMNYDFVANYFGGSGNDLVLQWADTTVAAWGSNSYGQLGDATTTRRLAPAMIDDTGVLAGKTILAVAGGYLHSLALCSDGTLAAWGYNVYGQLGNNGSAPSSVPVAVDQSGVLAGKTVIAISAGPFHNLALCADGTMAAWGYNNYGQLGTGDKVTSRVPVLVNPVAALAGKQVVAVAAAAYSSFALCADGTLTGWGYNDEGELGDGTTSNSTVPVAVDTSGALSGKRIASLSAGQYHTLALCTDGTLVAWGYNNRGQLGNNSNVSSKVPVAIGSSGILSGKTVVATRASGAHSLALCADGTLAAWGWNHKGQLGATSMTQSPLPLAVDTSGVTAGAAITQIAIGGTHNLALCTDGTLAAWGDNAYGQLGNNSLTTSPVPVAVDMSSLETGARVMFIASGSAALHNLAVVALPSASSTPLATTLQGSALGDSDHDGIANLIEYAFGLSEANSTARLPLPQRAGDSLEMRFTEPAGVTGISYGAEWSATLQPGSWKDIPDSGTGNEHIFRVPAATAPNLFLRLKVTQP